MPRFAFAVLVLVAGCFTVTVGKDDGVAAVIYDDSFSGLPDLAVAPDGDVLVPTKSGEVTTATIATTADGSRVLTFARELVVFTDAQAAHDLDSFGPAKIRGIQSIDLMRATASYDGLDTTRVAPPAVTIGSRTLGPNDADVELDGDTVAIIKADLLVPQAVVLPFALTFIVPEGQESALASELHVVIVLQPELTIDGSTAL